MVHRVKTAFGPSEETYDEDDIEDWENTPQGILQGNASGPTVWSLLSSVIFECLYKQGHSVHFCSALSCQLLILVGFSYVDDTDLFQTGETTIEVLVSMQELINSFGSLLQVTGGAISADKSWFYLVDYVWKRPLGDNRSGRELRPSCFRCQQQRGLITPFMLLRYC